MTTSNAEFPPLRLAVLNGLLGLKERMASEPELFERDDCPYDIETIGVLKTIMEIQMVDKIVEKIVSQRGNGRGRPRKVDGMNHADLLELDEEVKGLLKSLKDMESSNTALDTNERVQIMKTRAALIDKALTNKERVFNLKSMSEFQTTVISILDDLINEDGRDDFLNRIEPFRE